MTAGARDRVEAICAALPEATAEDAGAHARWAVRGRAVAWFLDDHHGDGRRAVCVTVAPGDADALVAAGPERHWIPAYPGRHGRLACAFDLPEVDGPGVAESVVDSHRIVAPKRLVALLP